MKHFIFEIRKSREKLAKQIISLLNERKEPVLLYSQTSNLQSIVDNLLESIENDLEKPRNNHLINFLFKNVYQKGSANREYQALHSLLFIIQAVLVKKMFSHVKKGIFTDISIAARLSGYFQQVHQQLQQKKEAEHQERFKTTERTIRKLKIVKDGLQKQLNTMHQVFRDLPIPIIGLNEQFEITMWNAMATRLTGFSSTEIIGHHLTAIIQDSSHMKLVEKIKDDRKWSFQVHLSINKKTGIPVPVVFSVRKLKYQFSERISYIVSIFELSERELIKNQSNHIKYMTTISRLTNSFIHDVRNPLHSIGLNSELIEQAMDKQNENEQIAESVQKIQRQVADLTEKMSHYMEFSRISELHFRPINFTMQFRELVDELVFNYATARIKINYNLPDEPFRISGDWDQLKRVFSNIIQNAVDAMPKGGKVFISVKRAKNRIRIVIRDTGSGIPGEQIKKIYDPYFTTKSKGVGLGLFIAKEIILAHHGKIFCSSRSGEGTKFSISFIELIEEKNPQKENNHV